MGTDMAEPVEKLRSASDIKVHSVMCIEIEKLVDSVVQIFPEIEAARPRCSSGILSLCLLNIALDKAKSLLRDCSESSKLYLALKGNTVLSRGKNAKKLLEQSLSQIQTLVPVMLASKISWVVLELQRVKLILDPSEEEAGKAVRTLLEGYRTGARSETVSDIEYIKMAALKLKITSQKALLLERRSIKKLLNQLIEGDRNKQKKQILVFLWDMLNKYGKLIASSRIENDNVMENQEIESRMVDLRVDREEARRDTYSVPPEQFKCPISLKLMYDPVVIDSGETFERMWIQKWFDEGHDVCPKTNRKLSNMSMVANTAMKNLILRWGEEHGVTVSDPSMHFSTDSNPWENSCSSVVSLSSMYSLQLPVDYSNLSLGSLDSSRTIDDSCDLDTESSPEIDGSKPWDSQCRFVEELMAGLERDERACRLLSCEKLVGSIVRFLKAARDLNDVIAQRIGCSLLLILVAKCRSVKYLTEDAYMLIVELLESEVMEEALSIIEELSSRQTCRSEITSSGSLPYIFKILDTQTREIQTRALKILDNLTLTRTVHSILVSSGLVPKLIDLSEDESFSGQCLSILTNLWDNPENKNIIVEAEGCISFITKVLKTSDRFEEQDKALEILLSLCSQSIRYCKIVINEGVIPSVFSISVNGHEKMIAKAQEMIRLLGDTEIEEKVKESADPMNEIPKDSNRKTPSKTSRIFSKIPLISRSSLAQKRKV